jgi:hypothetical protein
MALILSGTNGLSDVDGSASTPAIRGTDTNTGIYFPGNDRIGFAEGGVQVGEFDASGNFQFNSGYGSTAIAYGCRAWVNFNGTGTVTIRASGNVTSITDNGVGNYLINLTTALPDSNASVTIGLGADSGSTGTGAWASRINSISTTIIQILSARPDGSYSDASIACVAVHR